jgi:hypothetical protein
MPPIGDPGPDWRPSLGDRTSKPENMAGKGRHEGQPVLSLWLADWSYACWRSPVPIESEEK